MGVVAGVDFLDVRSDVPLGVDLFLDPRSGVPPVDFVGEDVRGSGVFLVSGTSPTTFTVYLSISPTCADGRRQPSLKKNRLFSIHWDSADALPSSFRVPLFVRMGP